ncbi:MAG: ABC transporter ATP-binding protein [Deltaproteobacteria bacterium]|nr:ABC transporter ATP-binding protein [Deltaproteobacteria bacterium]
MQARLCLSMISCRPCDILILDEVFDGADAFFREKISSRILKMIESSGAVLFVSHGMEQVRRVCNRVLVLKEGAVVFDGDVETGIKLYGTV